MPGNPLLITLPSDGQVDWGEGALNDILDTIINDIEAKITADEIQLNGNFDFEGYSAEDMGGIAFRNGSASSARRLYFVSNELWVTDGSGNNFALTLNGTVNSTASGSIVGLAGSGASVSYSSANLRFTFLDQTTEGAQLEANQVRLRKPGTSTVVVLKGSAAMSSDYNVTFPSGTIAAGTGLITMDSAGLMGVTKDPSVKTVTVSGDTTAVGNIGVYSSASFYGATVESGSYAHTTRTKTLGARADFVVVGTLNVADYNTVSSTAGAMTWVMKLDVEVGERFRSLSYNYTKADVAASMDVSLWVIEAGGGFTKVAYLPNGGAATVGTTTTSTFATAATGSSSCHYQLLCSVSASSKIRAFTIVYDRPVGGGG